MSSMNLKTLLEDLDKATMVKQASAAKIDDTKPAISTELEHLLSKEASAPIVSDAMAEGEKLATFLIQKFAEQALLDKKADEQDDEKDDKEKKDKDEEPDSSKKNADEDNKEDGKNLDKDEKKDMKKEAQDNRALAALIMEKLAAEDNGPQTVAGIAPAPNKLQVDAANMVAQHDQRIQPTPNGGTLSNMVDSLVSKAVSQGAAPYDQVPALGDGNIYNNEGIDPAMGTPALPVDDAEKMAAVQALLEAGADFDTAVDLIKAAAVEIENEEMEQVKVAAVNELLAQGWDITSAVNAVNAAIVSE